MKMMEKPVAMLALFAASFGTLAHATTEPAEIQRPDPLRMSMAEIRAFNASLPPKHRYFIICRQSEVTGSLAKTERRCMTRDDWERGSRSARDDADEAIDSRRSTSGCTPMITC